MIRPLLVAFSALGLLGCVSPKAPQPIVVGHVGNLQASSGKSEELGLRLATHELDAEAQRQARGDVRIVVRHADTRGAEPAYEAEAARLTAVNRAIAIVGGHTAEEVVGLDRSGVPVLALLGLHPAGADKSVFCLGMQPAVQGEVLARFLRDERKARQAVLVVDETRPAALALAEAFGRVWHEGGKTTLTELRRAKDGKLDELAQRIAKVEHADALVFAGPARDLRSLRAELGLKRLTLVFAGDDGDTADLPAEKEGVYLATAFDPGAQVASVQDFVKKYRDAFQSAPDVYAALAYEALRLVGDAIGRSDGKSDKLAAALAGVKDFPGLLGPLTMTDQQVVRRALLVVRLEGRQFVVEKRYDP